MTELFKLALKFDLKSLFLKKTPNVAIQAFRGLFVGVIAFVADAGILWLLATMGIHYLAGAVFGFIFGVMVNYTLSVMFVFNKKASISRVGEIMLYFVISLVGLGLTIGLMWFFTEIAGLFFMISKAASALIAYAWNFTSRKLILYKNGG